MRGLRRPSLLGGAGVRASAQRNRNARLAASGLRLSAQRVMAHYYLLRDAHSEELSDVSCEEKLILTRGHRSHALGGAAWP